MADPVSSYQGLQVWRSVMKPAEECYRLTKTYPK